jgi:hypothetical protein
LEGVRAIGIREFLRFVRMREILEEIHAAAQRRP